MREPPMLGSRVRSPSGAVWTVAQIIDYGSDTYTATCVAVERRKRKGDDKDLAAHLLQRTRESLSPRAIRRRWRERNYIP